MEINIRSYTVPFVDGNNHIVRHTFWVRNIAKAMESARNYAKKHNIRMATIDDIKNGIYTQQN